ncbi:MAG: hypothetical protein ACOCT9_01995 [archaeon]
MRLYQLLEENGYMENLKDDVINLLTISSSIGMDKIKTKYLVKDLVEMGYDVDERTILSLLDEIDIVTDANNDVINISTEYPEEETDLPDFDDSPIGDFDDEVTNDEEEDDDGVSKEVQKSATNKSMRDIRK